MKTAIVSTLSVVIAILAIYLTPLKHLNIVEPSIRDIEPREFYDQWQKNKDEYLLIDVRPAALYQNIHVEGSRNVELHVLYDERHNLPKRGKKIVLICSGGRASGVGYSYLEHYGFLNLYRIKGGIEKWQADGLPVVTKQLFPQASKIETLGQKDRQEIICT